MPATKIMIVRHAEKPGGRVKGVTAAGSESPQELVVRGWQRSGALVRLFAPRHGKFVDRHLARPKTIFAPNVDKHSDSLRPQHTVLALATLLEVKLDLRFPKDDEAGLVKAAIAAKGLCSSPGSMRTFRPSSTASSTTIRPARRNGPTRDSIWCGSLIAGNREAAGSSDKSRSFCCPATAKSRSSSLPF
jgi:hypothetical protein